MNLTAADIEILIEAMTSWESRHAAGDILGSVFAGLLAKDEDGRKKALEENKNHMKSQEAIRALDREKSILIKAKLIALKDSLHAESLTK